MISVYSKNGELLNVIYNLSEFKQGERFDITDGGQYLQCAIMRGGAGKSYRAHKHLDKAGMYHIQEAFIIIEGMAKVHIYDNENNYVGDYPLIPGDISVLLKGGHSLEIEKDCLFWEIKSGPYSGQMFDKMFI